MLYLKRLFFVTLLIYYIFPIPEIYAQDKTETIMETVKSVKLAKYTGIWYEVAKIPNRFQKQCDRNTTATYELQSDGTLSVINRCIESDGSEDSADGVARVVDTLTNARLEVSFFSILGFHLFWGDYWIIGLDEDYQFAVIGTPSRKYGWILCRQPKISDENMEKAFAILRSQDYNPDDFILSRQTE